MRRGLSIASGMVVLAIAWTSAIAQANPTYDDVGDDNPRGNVHLGAPIVIPLNPTAEVVHFGFGAVVGGGYNFTRRHALVAEFMWNNLLPTNEALAQLRTTLGIPNVNASVDLTSLTGNYRFELRGRALGTYFIGGAGLYYRHTHLSQEIVTGSTIKCTRTWESWGYTCTNGFVTANQTIGSWSETGGGFNGGIGFTTRVSEPPYRFYVESRYHYAPNSRLNTQFVDIAFGIRY